MVVTQELEIATPQEGMTTKQHDHKQNILQILFEGEGGYILPRPSSRVESRLFRLFDDGATVTCELVGLGLFELARRDPVGKQDIELA